MFGWNGQLILITHEKCETEYYYELIISQDIINNKGQLKTVKQWRYFFHLANYEDCISIGSDIIKNFKSYIDNNLLVKI